MSSWTKFHFVFLLGILGGCQSNPGPPINSSKMVKVLTALHIAEANGNYQRAKPYTTRDSSVIVQYHQVLREQNVTVNEFMTSYRFYLGHLDTLNAIYVKVNEELSIIAAQRDAAVKQQRILKKDN